MFGVRTWGAGNGSPDHSPNLNLNLNTIVRSENEELGTR
jgi:hypothetical protein